jgi:hypothetical protein
MSDPNKKRYLGADFNQSKLVPTSEIWSLRKKSAGRIFFIVFMFLDRF